MFFAASPEQYISNVAFEWKMGFLLLSAINILMFYLTVYHEAKRLGAGDDAPFAAKIIAGFSIFLWAGVIFFGRMLPYIGSG